MLFLFGALDWVSSALFALFVARGFYGVLAAASYCGKPLLELEALLFGVGFFLGFGLTPIGPPCGPPWGGTSSGGSSSPARGRIMDGGSSLVVLVGAALRLFFTGFVLRGNWARGLFVCLWICFQLEPAMRPTLHDLVDLTETVNVSHSVWAR